METSLKDGDEVDLVHPQVCGDQALTRLHTCVAFTETRLI